MCGFGFLFGCSLVILISALIVEGGLKVLVKVWPVEVGL